MANLSAVISADTSKFVSGIKSAQEMLDKFVKETDSASKSAEDNISVTNEQAAAYQRVIKQLEKVGSGTMSTTQQQKALADQVKELKVQWQNLSDQAKSSDFGKSMADTMKLATTELDTLKQQLSTVDDIKPTKLKTELRLTTDELVKLTAQYRALSAAEKASPFGVELAAKMDDLRAKAGTLTDTIGDVQQEIKIMASDTPNLDVFNSALGIGADMLSTYSALVAKVTGNEEDLKNAIATIAAVQSAANLVTKVSNALQSSSVIMLKTRKIQEGAAAVAIRIRTAAEGKGTVATKAATAAQAAFNVVANANPYVLLATALITAVSAIVMFTKNTKESREEQEKQNKAIEEAKQRFDDYAKSVGNNGADLISKYTLLKESYNKLKTEHQKLTWIKNNKTEFEKLGLKVNNLTDAENVFVKNTGAVVEALKKRAIAAAKQAQLTELSGKLLEEQTKAEALYQSKQVKAGDKSKNTSHTTEGGKEFVDNKGNWVYTTKGAEEANKKLKKEVYSTVNSIQKQIDNLAKDIAGSINLSTLISGSTTGGDTDNEKAKEEEIFDTNSLKAANEQVAALKKQLESMNPDDINFQNVLTQLHTWENIQKHLNDLINGTKEEVKSTDDEVKTIVTGSLAEATKMVKDLTEKLENMSPDDENFQKTIELLNEWKAKQDAITKSIEGTGDAYKDIADSKEIDTVLDNYDKLANSASGIVGSVNSVYEAFKNFDNKLADTKNGWEEFVLVFESGMTILDAVANTITSITTILEMLNTVKQAGTAITAKDTATTITNTAAKVGEAGANITEAGTAGAVAAAESAKSVASIPIAGPALAAAAILLVMGSIAAAIASAKSFASGGIIEGATSVGDYNIAKVNNGEMILNGTQQKKLFNLLDGNSFGTGGTQTSGQVEFKIKGTELIGCINNVNKKKSKI